MGSPGRHDGRMSEGWSAVREIAPALAFLLAGVPLAALLDELGFFAAAAARLQQRFTNLPVVLLWLGAAATTVVLNLDTTIVLLTPLFVRLARRADVDPVSVALVPLLLASLASSVLPVSNLTTLIAADRLGLSVADVVTHLGLPSLGAVAVGWFAYRRNHARVLVAGPVEAGEPRALMLGGAVVAGLLVAFTLGPAAGVQPWVAAVVADVVLIGITRTLPWRHVPVATAAAVAGVAALVAVLSGPTLLRPVLTTDHPLALIGTTAAAVGAANVVNNIPATLVAVQSTDHVGNGWWAWLLGVNAGAVLLPTGALANVLWRRILAADGIRVPLPDYLRRVWPVAVPAIAAAAVIHALLTVNR